MLGIDRIGKVCCSWSLSRDRSGASPNHSTLHAHLRLGQLNEDRKASCSSSSQAYKVIVRHGDEDVKEDKSETQDTEPRIHVTIQTRPCSALRSPTPHLLSLRAIQSDPRAIIPPINCTAPLDRQARPYVRCTPSLPSCPQQPSPRGPNSGATFARYRNLPPTCEVQLFP